MHRKLNQDKKKKERRRRRRQPREALANPRVTRSAEVVLQGGCTVPLDLGVWVRNLEVRVSGCWLQLVCCTYLLSWSRDFKCVWELGYLVTRVRIPVHKVRKYTKVKVVLRNMSKMEGQI